MVVECRSFMGFSNDLTIDDRAIPVFDGHHLFLGPGISETAQNSWVMSHVPIFHITQPLDSIRYMVY